MRFKGNQRKAAANNAGIETFSMIYFDFPNWSLRPQRKFFYFVFVFV